MTKKKFYKNILDNFRDSSHVKDWFALLEVEAKLGMWSFDTATAETWYSPGIYKIFDLRPTTYIEDPMRFYGTQDREMLIAATNEAANTGKEWDYTLQITSESGMTKWVRTTGHRRMKGNKAILYGMLHDVTEFHNIKSQLVEQEAINEHQSKLAQIGELSAGVGHEINNPLAIITGNIRRIEKLLGRPQFKVEEIMHSTKKMWSASWRIRDIVDGLRTFSRVDDAVHGPFEVNQSISQTISLVREIYSAQGVQIHFNPGSEDILAIGSMGKVQQIIMNLISNAHDALLDSATPNKVIKIEAEKNDRVVKIHVQDNGPGIPEEIQKRMFESFYTTKEPGKGTGLGLSISHTYAREMGGALTFSSNSDSGTDFILNLMHAKSIDDDMSLKRLDHLSKIKVLLVEDLGFEEESLLPHLEALDLNVVKSSDIQSALTLPAEIPYDVVFIHSANIELSSLQRIRMDQPNQSIMVVAVDTQSISETFQRTAYEKLLDAKIEKPFTTEEIRTLIYQLMVKQVAA